jgi:hypothetical protein
VGSGRRVAMRGLAGEVVEEVFREPVRMKWRVVPVEASSKSDDRA